MLSQIQPLPCGCIWSTSVLRTSPPVLCVHAYCDAHRPCPRPGPNQGRRADFNKAACRALAACRQRDGLCVEIWGVVLGLVFLLVLTLAAAILARKLA